MADTQTQPKEERRQVTLALPMMSIQLHKPEMPSISMPHIPLPHISKQEMGHAVDVAKSILPPPERVAYYGALGALAVFGVVEWPVAAAIGMGTVIAQRARRNGNGDGARPMSREPVTPKPAEKGPERRRTTASKAAEAATAKRKEAEATTAKRKAATVRETLKNKQGS